MASFAAPCGWSKPTTPFFWRDGKGSMADLTDEQLDAAIAAGRAQRGTAVRARRARFDRRSGRIVVELTNGCLFAFPARAAQGLEHASDAEIAAVTVLGAGYGLHWEALDVDLSVPGLLAGMFGTAAWMVQRGGQATSPAKAAAARENGRKGGRPRRSA